MLIVKVSIHNTTSIPTISYIHSLLHYHILYSDIFLSSNLHSFKMQFITILAVLAPAMAGVSAKCVDAPYDAYWYVPPRTSQAPFITSLPDTTILLTISD